MPDIATRAGLVSYEDTGKGAPVVMLHATLHDRHDFDAITPTLSRQYRTISMDWPWHGDSARTSPRPGAVELADVLVDVVTTLDLPPALFIGNSVGGFCAARLAITHPHRVRGLVLVNTGGFVSWNPANRLFCHLLGLPVAARWMLPRIVPAYMKARTRRDKEIAGRVARRAATVAGSRTAATLWRSFTLGAHDLRQTAGRITAPALIVWGAHDPLTPERTARNAQRSIPLSRFETLPTGHVAFASAPGAFLEVTQSFFHSVLEEDSPSTPWQH